VTVRYAIVCCRPEPIAVLRVDGTRRLRVKVEPWEQSPSMRIVTNPVIDGKTVFDPDELAVQTHRDVVARRVTEIQWDGHRSWVIRCGESCSRNQQAQIRAEHLPRIAAKLAQGRWDEQYDNMPVVPLGVLSRLTDPRNC